MPTPFSGEELADFGIEKQIPSRKRPTQLDAVERSAAAQRHVGLSVRESALPHVDDDALEGLALALMDGHRPRQLVRELREAPDRFRHYSARRRIESVTHAFPDGFFDA